MPRPLSSADLRDLHQILEGAGIIDFYRFLRQRHYGFAAWAGSAGNDDTANVPSPDDFLRNSELHGICSPIFQILGKTQIDKMRSDLAKAYCRALQKIGKSSMDNMTRRDLTAVEISIVYREALERNGLSIENWNLYFPLTILQRLGGETTVEIFWEFLRDSSMRSPHVGAVVNLATIAFMYKQTMSTDTKVRQMANAWLSRNPAMDGQEMIETRFNWALDAVRFSDFDGIADFLEALDLEGHEIPYDTGTTRLPSRRRPDKSGDSDDDDDDEPLDDWETELESVYIYRALMSRLTGTR